LLALYLAALLASLGVFVLQLSFGHHDAGGGGHDTAHGGHDGSAWSLFASTRFWTFALLAFGLVGTLLTVFGLAGKLPTGLLAGGAGVASGLFAASVIRRLSHQTASSHGTSGDVVGRVGRVVVPLDATGPGKVRIEMKGSSVDYVARSRDTLAVEEAVVVEECDGSEVVVSRAPRELKP
jgi:membrane protein implicated in regulation of membrane protease activity